MTLVHTFLPRFRMLAMIALTGLFSMETNADPAVVEDDLQLVLLGQSLVKREPQEGRPAFQGIPPLLKGRDVVFTNLEISVCEPGRCQPTRDDQFFHGTTPDILGFVESLGVNLVSLANNHSWDYGTEGIRAMLEAVSRHDLTHAGIGLNLAAATAPAYLQAGDQRIALVAVASAKLKEDAPATESRPGVNIMMPGDEAAWERNLAAIRAARAEADWVIAYQHYQSLDMPEWQRSWAHAAIDNGVDIYVSHGEPTLGGIEVRGRGLIFYGLGNYIFHSRTEIGNYPADVWESVIAQLSIRDDRSIKVELTPIMIDEGKPNEDFRNTRGFPSLATPAQAASILERLDSMSKPLGTVLEIRDGKGYLQVGGK